MDVKFIHSEMCYGTKQDAGSFRYVALCAKIGCHHAFMDVRLYKLLHDSIGLLSKMKDGQKKSSKKNPTILLLEIIKFKISKT